MPILLPHTGLQVPDQPVFTVQDVYERHPLGPLVLFALDGQVAAGLVLGPDRKPGDLMAQPGYEDQIEDFLTACRRAEAPVERAAVLSLLIEERQTGQLAQEALRARRVLARLLDQAGRAMFFVDISALPDTPNGQLTVLRSAARAHGWPTEGLWEVWEGDAWKPVLGEYGNGAAPVDGPDAQDLYQLVPMRMPTWQVSCDRHEPADLRCPDAGAARQLHHAQHYGQDVPPGQRCEIHTPGCLLDTPFSGFPRWDHILIGSPRRELEALGLELDSDNHDAADLLSRISRLRAAEDWPPLACRETIDWLDEVGRWAVAHGWPRIGWLRTDA